MSNSYISYFDILGYKDAILNSDSNSFKHRVDHILRDIEYSLSLDQSVTDWRGVLIGDQSFFRTNVHYISDTILFWPKTNSIEDIENWFLVSYKFNQKMTLYNMPMRGCLYFGTFQTLNWHEKTDNESIYSVATIFGAALVNAHSKAENQSWASTVIDDSVVKQLPSELSSFLVEYCTEERVPYKIITEDQQLEYVFRLRPKEEKADSFEFYKEWIYQTFQHDKRDFSSQRVQSIYNNTISLLYRQLNSQ